MLSTDTKHKDRYRCVVIHVVLYFVICNKSLRRNVGGGGKEVHSSTYNSAFFVNDYVGLIDYVYDLLQLDELGSEKTSALTVGSFSVHDLGTWIG